MLTRFHKALLGVLVVQLALIALVWSRGGETGARPPALLLPGFDAAKVAKLVISDGGGSAAAPSLELAKQGSDWVVASSYGYPADAAKVSDFLAALAKLAAAEPLATSAARHEQLRVADAGFAHKVVVGATTLYIGAPTGARSTAVRLAGSDAVYGVASISASASPVAWVDPIYVHLEKADLAGITIERAGTKLVIARQIVAGDGSGAPIRGPWTVAIDGAPVTDALDTKAITKIGAALATIAMVAPADPKRAASPLLATITLESTHPPIVLDVADAGGGQLWLHDRSKATAVLVEASTLDAALHATRETLVTHSTP